MDNGLILYITLFIPLGLVAIFYMLLGRRKKNDAMNFKSDIMNFERAIATHQYKSINKYGFRLIQNTQLTMKHLSAMSKSVNSLKDDNEELKELRSIIYNKYLDWSRGYLNNKF